MDIIEYVKDEGFIIGCFVGVKTKTGYSIGWSKFNYSKENGRFDKEKAKEIAFGRAYKSVKIYDNIPKSFDVYLSYFIDRCNRYFKTKNPDNLY